jgi:hypothetical protein
MKKLTLAILSLISSIAFSSEVQIKSIKTDNQFVGIRETQVINNEIKPVLFFTNVLKDIKIEVNAFYNGKSERYVYDRDSDGDIISETERKVIANETYSSNLLYYTSKNNKQEAIELLPLSLEGYNDLVIIVSSNGTIKDVVRIDLEEVK